MILLILLDFTHNICIIHSFLNELTNYKYILEEERKHQNNEISKIPFLTHFNTYNIIPNLHSHSFWHLRWLLCIYWTFSIFTISKTFTINPNYLLLIFIIRKKKKLQTLLKTSQDDHFYSILPGKKCYRKVSVNFNRFVTISVRLLI